MPKLLTSADSAQEIQMKGGQVLAFKAGTGSMQMKVRVDDGEYVNLEESKTADFAQFGDFKDAVMVFEITGNAKLAIYGNFYA